MVHGQIAFNAAQPTRRASMTSEIDTFICPVKDLSSAKKLNGKLVAPLVDADGNIIGLTQSP